MKTQAPSRRDRLRAMLADLKMPGALEALDAILHDVDGGSLTAAEAMESLLGASDRTAQQPTSASGHVLIDRLLHHCHIINIRGNFYRMRHHAELWRTLNSGDSASAPSPPEENS